jgi:hypothetical protein
LSVKTHLHLTPPYTKKPTKGSKPNNWQLWKSIGQSTLWKYKVHKKNSKVPLRILRVHDMYKQVQCYNVKALLKTLIRVDE